MPILLAILLAVAGSTPPSAAAHFAAGDFDAAAQAYKAAIASNPNDADAHLGLGTLALYHDDENTAVRELSAASRLAPANAAAEGRLREARSRLDSREYVADAAGQSVTIPFVRSSPLPIIRVEISGKPAVLFIDTGAAGIDLSQEAAQRLGLHARVAGHGVFAGGKTADVLAATIPHVRIGGLQVSNVPSNVLRQRMEIGGYAVDGAIGTRFFYHFLTTIDYARGRLVLAPKSAPTTSIAGSRTAMLFVGDHFLFARARVNDRQEGWYNIDTGGDGIGIQMTKAALDAAQITPGQQAQSFSGGGGNVRILPFTAYTVKLGITRTALPGVYFPDGDQYGVFPFAVSGTLSDLFFRPGALTLDFAHMQLIVQ